MNGEGFKGFVKDGDRVKKGQVLIEFNLALIKAKAKSSITPIIITNSADLKSVTVDKNSGSIQSLAPLIKVRN